MGQSKKTKKKIKQTKPHASPKFSTVVAKPKHISRFNLKHEFRIGKISRRSRYFLVHSAVRISNKKKLSMKSIPRKSLNTDDISILYNEITVLRSVVHENIIQLYKYYECQNKIYLITELEYEYVFNAIQSKPHFSEKHSIDIIKDLANALKYLHEVKI